MIDLDEQVIRENTHSAAIERISSVDVFAEIDSTNSYLMQRPGPSPGKMSVAVTGHQTAGRGRLGKNWQSPPGAGVCMSVAYTFERKPKNLPALTLAIGLAAITALNKLGANGVQLKWPNDLVANDGKLGGILTEVQQTTNQSVTVVTGIGINRDYPQSSEALPLSSWAKQTIDLKRLCSTLPTHEKVASALLSELHHTFAQYELSGFASYARSWREHDWLIDREITLEVGDTKVVGVASGIADDGALLVDTTTSGLMCIASGSILSVGPRCSTA